MPKKTTTAQIVKAKALLIQGLPSTAIGKATGLNPSTVWLIYQRCKKEIEDAKKEVQAKVFERSKVDHEKILTEVQDNIAKAIKRISKRFTPSMLKKIPPSFLATTLGTLIDKHRLMRGESTQIMDHRFDSREEMLSYLNEGSASLEKTEPKQAVTSRSLTENKEKSIDISGKSRRKTKPRRSAR